MQDGGRGQIGRESEDLYGLGALRLYLTCQNLTFHPHSSEGERNPHSQIPGLPARHCLTILLKRCYSTPPLPGNWPVLKLAKPASGGTASGCAQSVEIRNSGGARSSGSYSRPFQPAIKRPAIKRPAGMAWNMATLPRPCRNLARGGMWVAVAAGVQRRGGQPDTITVMKWRK